MYKNNKKTFMLEIRSTLKLKTKYLSNEAIDHFKKDQSSNSNDLYNLNRMRNHFNYIMN